MTPEQAMRRAFELPSLMPVLDRGTEAAVQHQSGARQPSRDRNASGALRLLLASLVIVAHTPELIDGNRDREILYRLTGNLTFGSLAVNGIFLLSGLLISASYLGSAEMADYMKKRSTRIYPAFIASSLLAVLVIGPSVGGYHAHGFIKRPRKQFSGSSPSANP